MAKFQPRTELFSEKLGGKVVVLSGGSSGIGAATVRALVDVGAHVVFGDVNQSASEALVKDLNSEAKASQHQHQSHTRGTATFVLCDVTKYDDIYHLFKAAYDLHGGHIDHAISNAGIFETGAWFDPGLTIDTIQSAGPGPSAVIDINVMGSANFCRVAVVFLRDSIQREKAERKGRDDGSGGKDGDSDNVVTPPSPPPNKSISLLSSVNAFRESPGLYMYQTSKHAVHGLFRAMRRPVFERDGIRVNAVCPGVTESAMTANGILDIFKAQGLYWQPASTVAEILLGLAVQDDMTGKAIYVEGGEGWEFEDSAARTVAMWLGEEPARRMNVNTEAVRKGALTKK